MSLNSPFDFEKPIADLDDKIAELKRFATETGARADAEARGIDIDAEIAKLEIRREQAMRQIFSNLTPWNEVQMARHPQRPYTLDYIGLLFEDFTELHGDRVNADDAAIVGGFARFHNESVVVLGHQKARDLKERQLRNFGSARPAGFRKALRLMKLADKFNKPLIVFVDTPAAEANLLAEEEGISATIAVNLREMVGLRIPIVVAVIGEGGSGGALGIAVGDRILMLEHAVYSVIPPESCAAILWNDRSPRPRSRRRPETHGPPRAAIRHCRRNRCTNHLGGAHRNLPEMAATLKQSLSRNLTLLEQTVARRTAMRPLRKIPPHRRMGRPHHRAAANRSRFHHETR